jgi:hypothetical protein
VSAEDIRLRKGFSAVRLDGGAVRIRVKTDSGASVRSVNGDPIPTFRAVELSAVEWVDLIATVSAGGLDRFERAVDLHMGPAGDA